MAKKIERKRIIILNENDEVKFYYDVNKKINKAIKKMLVNYFGKPYNEIEINTRLNAFFDVEATMKVEVSFDESVLEKFDKDDA